MADRTNDGRCCVSVSYEDGAGVMRRNYVYGKTQAEANAKAKAKSPSEPVLCSRRVPHPRRLAEGAGYVL